MKYGKFIEADGEFAWKIRFLKKAVSKDETRPQLHNILIEPTGKDGVFRGVATDGRRVHMAEGLANSELEAGKWRVLKASKQFAWIVSIEDGLDFPNYQKVLPDRKEAYFVTIFKGIPTPHWRFRYTGEQDFVDFIRSFPEPTLLNIKYLEDLPECEWTVRWTSNEKAVDFRYEDYRAVIMPMQPFISPV